MADFEYEQLKTLFENLAERVDRTPGDQATTEELVKVRGLLERMNKQMAAQGKRNGPNRQDHKAFINEFFEQWKSENPLGTLKGQMGKDRKGTLIQEEKAKRAKGFKPSDLDPGSVTKNSKGFGAALSGMKNKLDSASGGLDNFMSNLKKGGILAALGGGSASTLGKVGGAIGERTDAYRDLLTSGEGTINSIQEMTNAANAAGMSARELADSLLKGSQAARLLGGLKFATLTNALTKTTAAAGNLGMTFEAREAATQDYLSAQGDRGQLRDLSQDQMTRGIIRLVKSSEQTAHILGLTREDELKAARERAADHAMNAVIRSLNMSEDAMNSLNGTLDIIKNTGGDAAENMLKQLIATGTLTTQDTTTLAATDPDMYRMITSIADRYRNGDVIPPEQIAQLVNGYAKANKNSQMNAYRGQMSIAGVMNPEVAGAFGSSLQMADKGSSINTDRKPDGLQDAGTRAYLDAEETARRAASALAAAFDAVNNSVMNKFGVQLENLALKMQDISTNLAKTAEGMQGYPTLMSTIGIGFVAVAAALPILGTAFKAFSFLKNGSKLFGFLRGGAAAGEGAAAAGGTAIAGEGAAAAGLGGEAAAAGGMGLLGTAAVGLGGLAVGGLGMYGGALQIDNRKGESFAGTGDGEQGFLGSRATGYATSIAGGAAGGALIGSIVPVIGTAIGGVIGGILGLGSAVYNDWGNISGSGEQANGSAVPALAGARPPQRPAANASSSGPAGVPMDQMMQRIMTANEASLVFLKKIKENSESQVSMMKDELSLMRSHNDKVIRLMEENNNYTKMSAMNGT